MSARELLGVEPEPTFDADGYPTDATLRVIRRWKIDDTDDCERLLEYVQKAWRYPTYFVRDERRSRDGISRRATRRWSVSTAGWSGNESLIDALQRNYLFWALCWVEHRRGGHFVFRT